MKKNDLKDIISGINEVNFEVLEKKKQAGAISSETYIYIENFIKMISVLLNEKFSIEYWEKLPKDKKQFYKICIGYFLNAVHEINNLTFGTGDLNNKIDHLKRVIEENYSKMYSFLQELKNSYEIYNIPKDFGRLKEYEHEAEATMQFLKEKTRGVQEVLADTTAVEHAKIFNKQANKSWWLVGASLALTIVILFGIYIWVNNFILKEISLGKFLKEPIHLQVLFFISRVFILSVLSGLLFTVLRHLNANMHLVVINRHRANCMKSAQALAAIIDDENTKNTIWRQMTEAIFKAGETGYIHKTDSNYPQINSGISLVDSAGKSLQK